MSAEPAGAGGVCCSHKSCAATKVVAANQSEVESALTSARAAHARATGELRELEETITKLEGALALTRAGSDDDPASTSMTLHEAMRKVLQAVPTRMMHAQDLAAEIGRLQLYRRPNGPRHRGTAGLRAHPQLPVSVRAGGYLHQAQGVIEMKGR